MNVILLDSLVGDSALITHTRQLTHMHNVLKVQVGDVVKVGILGGGLGTAIIQAIEGTCIRLTHCQINQAPPPKLGMTVVLALPRPKVLRRLVMDMTAMGVNHMVLMNSYRTEKSYWSSPLLARLDKFVLEGLEQGVDTIVPQITLAKRFKPFVEDDLPNYPKPIWLAHPYADRMMQQERPATLIVGAEGGFIPYEVALMQQNGAQTVSLGTRILRTEAAVSALLGRFL